MSLFESQQYCPSCMSSVKSANAACKACGFKPSDYPDSPRYLKVRTVLDGKYLVGCVLGENTFSVTYMGLELSTKKKKVIKEYCPLSCCSRDSSSREIKASSEKAELFSKGMKDFSERAEKLKNIAENEKTEGICRVTDIVETKGTVYAVFDHIDGTTLKKLVKNPDTALSPAEIFTAMRPIINSLIALHKENIFFGNISPFNIIISPDKKKADLIGFGICSEKDYAEQFGFTPKAGFTPIEEYKKFKGDVGGWTDIYGICASLYYGLTGTTPPDAADRTVDDTLKSLEAMGVKISENKNAALEQGMEIYERDRFKAVRALYNAMYSEDEEVVYSEDTETEAVQADAEENAAPEETAAPVTEEKTAADESPKEESKPQAAASPVTAPSVPSSSSDGYSQVIVRRKNKDTVEIGDERFSVKLTNLDLDGRDLNDDDTASIEDMSNLEYLSINDNRIGNVEFIGSLKKLIYISAKNNFISDISGFVNLGELRELYLAGNKDLVDISVLEHLRGIRKLDLSDTGVTEVHPLIYLDHLKYLNLKGLKLSQKQIKMLYSEMPTCNIRYDS